MISGYLRRAFKFLAVKISSYSLLSAHDLLSGSENVHLDFGQDVRFPTATLRLVSGHFCKSLGSGLKTA